MSLNESTSSQPAPSTGTAVWLVIAAVAAVASAFTHPLGSPDSLATVWAAWMLRLGRSARPSMRQTKLARRPDRRAAELRAPGPDPTQAVIWSAAQIQALGEAQFETLVLSLFGEAGFRIRLDSTAAHGVSAIWLYLPHQPGVSVGLVQCRWREQPPVGVDDLMALATVMADRDLHQAHFVTPGPVTPEAREFALASGITLLDIDALLALIADAPPDKQRKLLARSLAASGRAPTCLHCRTEMVKQYSRARRVAYWACRNFPNCVQTLPAQSN